jgi:hypothetical protein
VLKSFIRGLKAPSNEAEFNDLMETVDLHLRKSKSLPVHARPINGWLLVSASLGLGLRITAEQQGQAPRPGSYTGDDLTIRIFEWFDNRYKHRTEINFGPGRFVILLHGDPWIVLLPKIWSRCDLFVSQTLASSDVEEDLKLHRAPRLNVLDSIQGLPPGLKSSLDANELKSILEHFRAALEALSYVAHAAQTYPLIAEARIDFEGAVAFFMTEPPATGQAKWSSLQSLEKCLKAYIDAHGSSYAPIHDLTALYNDARRLKLPPIADSALASVQCSPAIRYGQETCTLEAAAVAHWSAIKACGQIAKTLVAQTTRP